MTRRGNYRSERQVWSIVHRNKEYSKGPGTVRLKGTECARPGRKGSGLERKGRERGLGCKGGEQDVTGREGRQGSEGREYFPR